MTEERTEAEQRLDKLFDELVPQMGPAESVAGEMVRAVARIEYRFYNDGDLIGEGYGNETCNPAARYLQYVADKIETGEYGTQDKFFSRLLEQDIYELWGEKTESYYEISLENLISDVTVFIDRNPKLKTTENKEDYLKFFRAEDRNYETDFEF